MGGRKLYLKLQPFMEVDSIHLGRDGLFALLATHHLLIRKRKRKIQTTLSHHRFRKYANLIKDFKPTGTNQLWVSDITYWQRDDKNYYITFITDTYSHKIVDYHVGESLATMESVQALRLAIRSLQSLSCQPCLIHHSDRGIQYCRSEYVKLLEKYKIKISMTTNGDPLENAVAERVNGIIKNEYLYHYQVNCLEEARQVLEKVINLYNNHRPHMSIGNYTPAQLHDAVVSFETKKLWKNYYQEKLALVNSLQD